MRLSAYGKGLCIVLGSIALFASCNKSTKESKGSIEYWTTSGNRSSLLKKAAEPLSFTTETDSLPAIHVDTTQHYQTIDGFGYALTGGSAWVINQRLYPPQRDALLRELFSADSNSVGISYLRISIGASDLDDHAFTYDDLPPGQKDVALAKFSIDSDRKDLIPVLKQILELNPRLKIMGSPWSAPTWMKTNNRFRGGSLKPEYYKVYADYLVRYVQAMAEEGIPVDAITVQNEPENPNNTPSLVMTAPEQADFIKNHLGPAFDVAGLKTKIVVFDHNCDHPEYPIAILNDPGAKKYVNGSAFHLYLGKVEALSAVHDAHPDRSIYFTEQWTSGKGDFNDDLRWHTRNLIIGAPRNWSRNVLEWNLAADPEFNPHTSDGGCTECMGALTIGDSVTRNVSYYIIAHASKWVRPGSVRVASNFIEDLPNVAFVTPAGKMVLIVLNDTKESKSFRIQFAGKSARASLPEGTVGTFVW